jgi:hypothetical protein
MMFARYAALASERGIPGKDRALPSMNPDRTTRGPPITPLSIRSTKLSSQRSREGCDCGLPEKGLVGGRRTKLSQFGWVPLRTRQDRY